MRLKGRMEEMSEDSGGMEEKTGEDRRGGG